MRLLSKSIKFSFSLSTVKWVRLNWKVLLATGCTVAGGSSVHKISLAIQEVVHQKPLSSPEANWSANMLELKAVAARTFLGTQEECEHTGMPRFRRERALHDSWDPAVKVCSCTMNATPKEVVPQVRRQINKVTMEIWSGLLRSMKLSVLSVLQCG